MEIREISPLDKKVQQLISQLDKGNRELYPEGPNYLESAENMVKNSTMMGIFLKEDLIAMGALKWFEGFAEVKRVYVVPEQRGKRLSVRVMDELEKLALENGIETLRLETGVRQPEAVSLYRKLGYFEIESFGDYRPDPMSLFFEKNLSKS